MIFLKMHVAKTIKNIAMYDPFTSQFIQLCTFQKRIFAGETVA